ncbi:MAG: Rieske 2Fe-2S domain-containing protein, partial [Deltaproteobacteria bacterium]|nr:Rieske 2Fe-2S domain-containing protein [Deltaproteobacteria bacterium]
MPAVTSDDIEADGSPRRVRLLGENLVAFRTGSGKVGLISHTCPHRGASLYFGRNEEEGLRCVYHGWKFDVNGACVDQPGEPEENNFKARVSVKSYPCVERGGIVWTYMGPRKSPPPLPRLEANMDTQPSKVGRILRYCNWLQALEGDIDTLHSEYLHSPAEVDVSKLTPGTGRYYRHRMREKFKYEAKDTDYGTSYGSHRPAEEDRTYWRIAHFLFPCFTMTPTAAIGSTLMVRFWVPLDDEHVVRWTVTKAGTGDAEREEGRPDGGMKMGFLPDTPEWFGRFRPVQRMENDYLIDRGDQKSNTYTGISGIVIQDTAVSESMGPILDRTVEHLGVSDTMIIRTRKRLLDAVRALGDGGVVPPGVDNPEVYETRAGWMFLPKNVDWWEGSKEMRRAFSEDE